MDASSDWQWLPEGLLDLITKRLVSVSDYLHFSVVCKHWHSVAIDDNLKKLYVRRSFKEPPKLMIPTQDCSTSMRDIYNVCQGKILNFKLKVPFNSRCCGSSHGWLAFPMKDHSVILYNPFTGGKLHPPPLDVNAEYLDKTPYSVHKIILSANPYLTNNFLVAAIYGCMNRVAYIRLGQRTWTEIPPKFKSTDKMELCASDVIFHQNMIYALSYSGEIVSKNITTGKRRRVIRQAPKRANPSSNVNYLVESSRGEIHMVRRFLDYIPQTEIHKTFDVEIYRLVKSHKNKFVLELINDLKGDTFFLGDNHSMSVVASKFSGCQPNCIYFTDDYYEFYYPDEPRDIGFYSLEDKSFEMHYVPDPIKHKEMPPPIWITPTPN